MASEPVKHDQLVEEAVLASCITSKEALWEALVYGLTEEDFYLQKHRLIWQAVKDIGENGSGEADEAAVIHWLRRNSSIEAIGGARSVTDLTNDLPAPGLVRRHMGALRSMKTAREIDTLCAEVACLVDPEEKVQKLESGAIRILGKVADASTVTVAEVIGDGESFTPTGTTPSGLSSLDSKVVFRDGAMIVLAATPGSGKTSLALQIAMHNARYNRHVLFASAEMAASELIERIIAQATGLGPQAVRSPSGHAVDAVTTARMGLRGLDTMHIMQPGAMTPSKIGAMAKMLSVRHPISMIVADYLQLMGIKGQKGFTREQIVGEIARQLKVLAQELRVPLIACSQLNRRHKTEKRAPEMHDLRESGAIEAHADAVVMLDRQENESTTMVYIRKDRFGLPGRLRLNFGNGGKFEDLIHDVPF